MKKMGLIFVGIFLVNGCASIPATRVFEKGYALPKIEAIAIGKVILYEKITRGGAETNLNFVNERNDEFAQKVITLFQKRFSERLTKKGIKVVETPPMPFVGLDVNLAYRVKSTDLSELSAQMYVFCPVEVFTGLTGTVFVPHKKNIILELYQVIQSFGEPELLVNHIAEQFSDVLAERFSSE